LKPRNARQIRENPTPLPKPLIEGIINEGELCIVSAPLDSFKSTIALELANAINTGEPFLTKFPVQQPGPVYFIQQEVHPGVFDKRVNNLSVNSNNQDDFWVDYDEFHMEGKWWRQLEMMLDVKQPKLVLFDPLSNCWPAGMEENNNALITSILRHLLVMREGGTSFLLVHGDAKPGADGQPNRLRGGTDLGYKPDTRIFVDRLRRKDDGELLDIAKVSFRTRNRKLIKPFYVDYTEDERLVYRDPSRPVI